MKPKRTEKIKWSPKLAYTVGLITTDGSLSNDKHHIVLVSKDIQLLKTFKKILGLENKIGLRKSGYTEMENCHHVQFGDVIFYKWLLKIGLTPNKTKRLGKLKIPNEFFFDFLRGCFDGDGGCSGYWDKRWKNSFMFYTRFDSGRLHFLKWLRNKLRRLLNIKGALSRERRGWRLKFAKKESKILFSKMYYKESLPCLQRKCKKLTSFIKIDNY